MDRRQALQASLIGAAGWALSGLISLLLIGPDPLTAGNLIGARLSVRVACWALAWMVGGISTLFALRRTNRSLRWQRILPAALVWGLAAPLPWYWRVLLGAGFTILTLRQVHPMLGIRRSLAVIAGWFGGWAVPLLLSLWLVPPEASLVWLSILSLLRWLVFGAAGSAVTFWQLGRAGWAQRDRLPDAQTWSLPRLVNMVEKNPVARRLAKKDIERQIYAITGAAFLLSVVGLIVSMSVWTQIKGMLTMRTVIVPFVIYLVTLAPTARAPLVVSSVTALLAAAEAGTQRFDLLRLTSLSEREVAWSYVLGPLRLLRGLLAFEYIVMLLMLAGSVCAFLPSFITAGRQRVLGVLVGSLWISIGLLGMNLLAAAIGMRVALWWREASIAAVVAPLFTLTAILLSLLGVAFGLQTMSVQPTLQIYIGLLCFMIAPYMLALDLLDTTQPWPAQ